MRSVVDDLLNIISDLEKKLKEKEEDLSDLIDYLSSQGIYITVHNRRLSSELDNKVLIDKIENKRSE